MTVLSLFESSLLGPNKLNRIFEQFIIVTVAIFLHLWNSEKTLKELIWHSRLGARNQGLCFIFCCSISGTRSLASSNDLKLNDVICFKLLNGISFPNHHQQPVVAYPFAHATLSGLTDNFLFFSTRTDSKLKPQCFRTRFIIDTSHVLLRWTQLGNGTTSFDVLFSRLLSVDGFFEIISHKL